MNLLEAYGNPAINIGVFAVFGLTRLGGLRGRPVVALVGVVGG